uniref:Methyltransferase n=1 Tax=Aegilops tauschii subsp. strangulata TaxID=200361 RepID=A0A453DLX3_AEGTS
ECCGSGGRRTGGGGRARTRRNLDPFRRQQQKGWIFLPPFRRRASLPPRFLADSSSSSWPKSILFPFARLSSSPACLDPLNHSFATPQSRSFSSSLSLSLESGLLDAIRSRPMALGHTRLDVRRHQQQHASSSSCCSAPGVAAFVGLCLVAVWMASSALVTPADFSPFQAPLWRRAAAPAEANAPPAAVREEETAADDQEPPVADRQQAGSTEKAKGADEQQSAAEKPEEKPDEKPKVKKVEAEVFPDAKDAELLNQTAAEPGSWRTQAAESNKETNERTNPSSTVPAASHSWKLCDVDAGADYIPCLDNVEAIRKLRSDKHYEHRERHCPEEAPTCLVPLPSGYRSPIRWPESRDQIWYSNVPHTKLVEYKGHQNWVNVSGEHLVFPGGGTQFKRGALHYIDFIQEAKKDVAWGKRTRVVLDVGCGVASFGGYLFDRDVLTMSFAPKDEHEAQVQFALERGIPAISAVMGTKRLPFPGGVFDAVHCARCRVPWHIEGAFFYNKKFLVQCRSLLLLSEIISVVWQAVSSC